MKEVANRDVLLVPSGEGTSGGETFRQLDDFEYFTGLEVPRSLLLIDPVANRSTLFTPARDPRFDNPGRPNDFPGRILAGDPVLKRMSAIEEVLPDDSLAARLETIQRRGARVVINLGAANRNIESRLPAFGTLSAGETLARVLQDRWQGVVVTNGYAAMARLRMIKSAREIDVMRRTAQVTTRAIAQGAKRVREGVDERTLTGAFIADCMASGAQRVPFTPIIKSGPNSLWPWRILGAHYDRRNRALAAGDLVIYDVGCELDHYVSDVGRTFPVSATFTSRQRQLVDMVKRVSDAVIAAARPGATLADLQRAAEQTIPDGERAHMQAPLYFGHHLGLDSGDPSLPDVVLAPGMIFTIEPWYYNHAEGVAVFIEDEILITATGAENLTAGLPRDAAGLEKLRAAR
jgi:Xaa-Pro aminopeptidase